MGTWAARAFLAAADVRAHLVTCRGRVRVSVRLRLRLRLRVRVI